MMTESHDEGLRQRKNVAKTQETQEEAETSAHGDTSSAHGDTSVLSPSPDQDTGDIIWRFLSWMNILVGLAVMVLLSQRYAQHLAQIHENDMWFSNIDEIEREISFRTESGLYYSYYKQMVQAPSVAQGMYNLIRDNVTEHPSTINVLARMNIYQEVLMGAIYKLSPYIQSQFKPVYFYINTIFFLQGVKMSALYLMTWLMSGTWVAAVLMSAFLVFNKNDETRVSTTLNLRENWSLPFFWIQILLLTYYFTPRLSPLKQRLCVLGAVVATTLFAVTWQFNQFVLLLQAMALFGTQLLHLLPHRKILSVYLVQLLSMLFVAQLQFGNLMIPTGLLFSFIPAAIIIMYIQSRHVPVCRSGMWSSTVKVMCYIVLVFILMIIINTTFKMVLQEEGDEHIYKFVLSKLGIDNPTDFDVNMYLCNGAFEYLPLSTFIRLTERLVFPLYVLVHASLIAIISADVFTAWRDWEIPNGSVPQPLAFPDRPNISYHAIQAVFYGLLAVTTLRMKYFWTPYIFVLASVGICDTTFWTWALGLLKIHSKLVISVVRHFILLAVLGGLVYIALEGELKELEELREFWDPDTVELMEWIKSSTPQAASFAGSMQLLAGVKLCTGRHITNHPHYEDKILRLKTKQIYQIYGHREPEDVYTILRGYQTDYIILEDSICMSPRAGCRTPDLIDLDNGVIPKDGPEYPGLVRTNIPLFCDQIRHQQPKYAKFFTLVLRNRTFRVYKVLEHPLDEKDIKTDSKKPPNTVDQKSKVKE